MVARSKSVLAVVLVLDPAAAWAAKYIDCTQPKKDETLENWLLIIFVGIPVGLWVSWTMDKWAERRFGIKPRP